MPRLGEEVARHLTRIGGAEKAMAYTMHGCEIIIYIHKGEPYAAIIMTTPQGKPYAKIIPPTIPIDNCTQPLLTPWGLYTYADNPQQLAEKIAQKTPKLGKQQKTK